MNLRPLAALLGIALLTVTMASCGDAARLPDRPADVTGVVAGAGDPDGPVLTEPSDSYYDHMLLLRGDPVFVRGDGRSAPYDELEDGDEIEVWVGDVCAESYPVQCDVTALRVAG